MSHHLGYKLTNGEVIYVDYRTPLVVPAIRRCTRAREAKKYPSPLDMALIERYALTCRDMLCTPPFDRCTHPA